MSDSSSKEWFAVDITVEAPAAEAIEAALNEIGAIGTEINLLGIRERQAETTVTGYFYEYPDEEILRFQISDGLRIYGFDQTALKNIEWRPVENRDWLEEWKKHWKPTMIGRFLIAPPWEAVGKTDKIAIRIEPNMAFGTGTHETTQLCLKAIGELYRPERTFLDVGTGTGILAIAAAKLGGQSILACDTDADSVKIAKENAIANGVSGIGFYHGSIDDNTPQFDFVCANLTIDVIVPILPLLIAKSRSTLLLSGILAEQKDEIASELRGSQISDFKFEIAGEWMSVFVPIN